MHIYLHTNILTLRMSVRIGLHSGPVTAGVLSSRLQLFGVSRYLAFMYIIIYKKSHTDPLRFHRIR
jgi:hypothetical protein